MYSHCISLKRRDFNGRIVHTLHVKLHMFEITQLISVLVSHTTYIADCLIRLGVFRFNFYIRIMINEYYYWLYGITQQYLGTSLIFNE